MEPVVKEETPNEILLQFFKVNQTVVIPVIQKRFNKLTENIISDTESSNNNGQNGNRENVNHK
jgi:hypothetical protein